MVQTTVVFLFTVVDWGLKAKFLIAIFSVVVFEVGCPVTEGDVLNMGVVGMGVADGEGVVDGIRAKTRARPIKTIIINAIIATDLPMI